MSFANDPGFVAFKNSHKHVAIQALNATVFILSYSEPLPPVGRRLTKAEGLQNLNQLKTILDEWSIVSFDQGGITGSGYHYEVKENVGKECGEGFILIPGIFQ
jgi:hypothetical protein